MFRTIPNAVLACSLLQAGLATAQSATNRPAAEKQIVANEKAIIEAIVKNDAKGFHTYVLPDGFALSGQGPLKVSDFDKVMEQMKADCKVTKWGLSDSTFHWINDNTVVHMYKETGEVTCGGKPAPPLWSSSVWTNKSGKWLSAFHHESEVVAAPAATKK